MNTKTTKFLAVLAVLAFAFAAFAIIAPAQENEAYAADMTISADKDTWTATELAYDEIDVTASVNITIPAAFTNNVTFYIITGKTVNFSFTEVDQTRTVTIQSSSEAGTATANTTFVFTGITKGMSFTATGGTVTAISALQGTATSIVGGTAVNTIAIGGNLSLTDVITNANGTTTYGYLSYDIDATTYKALYYAPGVTASSDVAMASNGDYAIVQNANVTVKQTTTNTGSVKFTGDTSTAGIKLTWDASTMKIEGVVKAENTNNMTVGGTVKVNTADLVFTSATTPSINAGSDSAYDGTTNYKFSSGATLIGPVDGGWELTSSAKYLYGNIDFTFKYGGTGVTHLVNSTGTITFYATDSTNNLTIKTDGYTGDFTADTAALTKLTVTYSAGNIAFTKGTFTSASTAFAGLTVEGATLSLTAAATISGAVAIGSNGELNVEAATTAFSEKVQVKDKGTLNIKNTTTFAKDVEVRGTMQITSEKAITVTNATFSLYGTLKSTDQTHYSTTIVTINADATSKSATFKAYDGSFISEGVQIAKGAGSGTITIDLSGATKIVYLSGSITSSTIYGQSQKVIINGDLEIVGGANVKVYGGFEVAEDSAIDFTIISGSFIVDSSAADVVLNGTMTVAENGTFTIEKAKSVKVNGIIYNDGTLEIKTSDATIANGGKIVDRAETGTMSIVAMTVAKGGVLQINGILTSTTDPGVITNAGTVIFERAVLAQNMTVDMSAAGASVEVKSYTNSATNVILKIVDDSMKSSLDKKTSSAIEFQTTGAIADTGAAGVTITESATSISSGDDKGYYPLMTVSGSLSLFDVRENKSVAQTVKMTLSDSEKPLANFEIADGFIVGPSAQFIVVDELTIENTMYFTGSSAAAQAAFKLEATSEVIVQGVIIQNPYVDNDANIDNYIHAVKFTTGTTEVYTYYASIESAVKMLEEYTDDVVLTLYGTKLSILESITIPANITINGTARTLTIGSDDDTDVAVYMKSGAKINSGVSLVVKGSIYAEVAKDIKSASIQADVKGSDGTDVLYTNVYSALDAAEAGDVVEAIQDITILKSITVKDGVQLYVPSGYDMYVNPANKVIITVNGMLRANEGMTLTTGSWGTTVSATVAVLDVEGAFLTGESDTPATIYTNYNKSVSGVYYNVSNDLGNYVYITDLSAGLETTAKNFYVYGKVVEALPVIAKTATAKIIINVMDGAEFKVAGITLDRAEIVTAGTGTITGNVYGQLGEDVLGSVSLGKYMGTVSDTYTTTTGYTFGIDAITGIVNVASGIVAALGDITAVEKSEFIVSDDAYFVIPYGKTVTLGQDYAIIGEVDVYGVLDLANEEDIILGDIEVVNDTENSTKGTLKVTKLTYLLGSILVDEGAYFNVNANLIVGLEPSDLGATAGVIAGDLDLADNAAIIVYPTADVSLMVIDPDAEGVSTAKVTLFYINEELYMAVYVSSGTTVLVKDVIAIPEFDLEDYETGDLKKTATWGATDSTKVGAYLALEATIDLKEIDITVSFVKGLSLYIDGVRMPVSGAFAPLTVGIHHVSASIDAGYACDNMAITFNGIPVPLTKDGAVVTITVDDGDSVLAVTGDVYVPTPEPVTPEEKSEWTITTILLVILVILIAVMAVIVALRLNRS